MKHGCVITELLKKRNMKKQELGILLGLSTPSNVNQSIERDTRISTFVKIMDILGYDVVVQPKKKKLLKEQIKITID